MKRKSTPEQIRARFDADVERFSNLETGQEAAMDSRMCMELIARGAALTAPVGSVELLDVGCGAGNYTLMFLKHRSGVSTRCTLLDLSQPMLDRASSRITEAGGVIVRTHHSDVRLANLGQGQFDVILAASVLHHLRGDDEWAAVFAKLHASLKPGGSLWVFDLVDQDDPVLRQITRERYADYLVSLKGEAYKEKVFAYIDDEDTPRSMEFQRAVLSTAGFRDFAVLHKNGPFSVYRAVK